MRNTLIGISIMIVFAFAGSTASAQVKPETVVANFYRAGTAKYVGKMNKSELGKFFSDAMVNKILKAQKQENGLNFDVLYYAQDSEIKSFKVGKAVAKTKTSVSVPVTFTNFGEKDRFEFKLDKSAKNWRITEITYTDGHTFTEVLDADTE